MKGCVFLIEYILFDLDGTLTDPKEGITKCVSHALKYFGIEKNPDELVCFIGPPLKEQFAEYANLSMAEAEKAVEIYRERFAPIGIFENKIYDGIIELLKELKDMGKTLAVATSKPHVFAQKIVEKYGMEPFFDIVVGSELDGTLTDKALVIEKTMGILGASSENTIMIGDRSHDVIGAHKNNIPCIGVSYGYAEDGELENAGVCALAASPEELKEILTGNEIF